MIAYADMKHWIFRAAAVATTILLAGMAYAQGVEVDSTDDLWKLERYEIAELSPSNLRAVEEAILADSQGGWLPVGIDKTLDGEALEVFFIFSESLPFEKVKLFRISSIERIRRNIDDLIWDGWVPVDIGVDAGDPVLMLIDTPAIDIEDWDLRLTLLDEETMNAAFSEMMEDGYSAWGMSVGPEATLWVLYLMENNREEIRPVYLNFHGLEMDGLREGLEDDILNGWIPWGYFIAPDSRYIQYTR